MSFKAIFIKIGTSFGILLNDAQLLTLRKFGFSIYSLSSKTFVIFQSFAPFTKWTFVLCCDKNKKKKWSFGLVRVIMRTFPLASIQSIQFSVRFVRGPITSTIFPFSYEKHFFLNFFEKIGFNKKNFSASASFKMSSFK